MAAFERFFRGRISDDREYANEELGGSMWHKVTAYWTKQTNSRGVPKQMLSALADGRNQSGNSQVGPESGAAKVPLAPMRSNIQKWSEEIVNNHRHSLDKHLYVQMVMEESRLGRKIGIDD